MWIWLYSSSGQLAVWGLIELFVRDTWVLLTGRIQLYHVGQNLMSVLEVICNSEDISGLLCS